MNRTAIALIILATLIRVALAALVPLFPDETYYWEWSRRLAAGYFDHPPAVAFLIRVGTEIFGATSLGVRFGAILAGVVASCAVVAITTRLSLPHAAEASPIGERSLLSDAETRSALLLVVIPAALVGFVLATPDAPLLAAVALTLAALERALSEPARSRATFGWWCAAGVAMGLAFCSKYTAVLLPFGVFIALLSRRALRERLKGPGPYVATAIALLIFLPTILWNARHEWISFAFQIHHGLGTPRGSATARELSLIGAQLGLITPVLAVMLVIVVARSLHRNIDDRRFVLAVVATTIIAFFMLSALRKPVEANWPFPAVVAALPLLATWQLSKKRRRWFVAGSVLAGVCTLIVSLHAATGVLPVPVRRDPISKAHGWDDLARAVTRASTLSISAVSAPADSTAPAGCSAVLLAADRYQDASEIALHLPTHPRVFALNLGGRPNQYDLWPSIYSVARPNDCALIVVDDGASGEKVIKRFNGEHAELVASVTLRWDAAPVARRSIWLVRGIPSAPAAEVVLSAAMQHELAVSVQVFDRRSVLLDSIVHVYRHGPIPYMITANAGASVSNADRQAAIAARIAQLHALLQGAGLAAVYRDARYPYCTFVLARRAPTTEIGYVDTPDGCKLAGGTGDALVALQRAHASWYAFATFSPGPP